MNRYDWQHRYRLFGIDRQSQPKENTFVNY